MGPVNRIFAALLLTSVCQMSPARAAGEDGVSGGPVRTGPMIQLGQGGTDKDRAREEEERRAKKRRRERLETRERLERERTRRWSEERRLRTERAVRELRERQRKEREARTRRLEEGFEAREERRRRARRARRLNADRRVLRQRFPPAWVVGIVEGRVEIGWSADAVLESWGPPHKVTRTAQGGEIWHYAAGRVLFSKGAVSGVVIERPAPSPSSGR